MATRLAVRWHQDFRDAPDGGVLFHPRGWRRPGWKLPREPQTERIVGLHLGVWLVVWLVPVWLAGLVAIRMGVITAPFALGAYVLWLRWLDARLERWGGERVAPRVPTPRERRRRRTGIGIAVALAVVFVVLLALRHLAGG